MNKLKPRNKICFQTKTKPAYLKNKKIKKYKKRKWIFIKNKIVIEKKQQVIKKPEIKKKFFKERLIEKQKFRTFYGCINNYKLKKIKKDNLINFFESRLDINILRFKKINTIFHVKQLINHNKIKVNNRIVNKINFILKSGDKLFIKKK